MIKRYTDVIPHKKLLQTQLHIFHKKIQKKTKKKIRNEIYAIK